MEEQAIDDVLAYLKKIPTPEYYNDLTPDMARKHVFNAYEEINDVLIHHNDITPTTRMTALQTLYNLEGEEEGIAMLRRQGVKDYTVKDVKAVLEKDALSPNVLAIIDALTNTPENNSLRVGRLI